MHQDLDDVLQHFGKKGMKWGVRNAGKSLQKGVKGHIKKRNAKQKITLEKYHEKKKGKKSYKKMYNQNLKKTKGNHIKSVRMTRATITNRNNAVALKVIATTAPVAIKSGRTIVRASYKMATSPQAVRAGKNIIQAAMRSNIRYVDGRKMTNVI